VLDSLVRVTRRVDENHCANILVTQVRRPDHATRQTDTPESLHMATRAGPGSAAERATNPSFRSSVAPGARAHPKANPNTLPSLLRRSETMLTRGHAWCSTLRLRYRYLEHAAARLVLIAFPLNNFKYFFTLFSKFFPSFPHGTCSLSVSRQYLALDEVYHPIRTALPSNPTRWCVIVKHKALSQRRGSNPLWHPVPRTDLCPGLRDGAPIDYNSTREPRRFSC